ncbi:glycosyltransferase family 4 protein [Brevibacillus humidisoli]|uniref:glycosyltransferase n=1 Tax=Brevibacillus humidisoli TaxID=2895522 RepID=UPI001E44B9EC|nr:glycosyltransferase [Brevibacillus humidisoli]UFJ42531.1 glycosyltransferase family 4 protein [Brevibacillus humidisoli]
MTKKTGQEPYKVLVIDDRIPVPELGCGYPRSLGILEGMADVGYCVTLFPLQFPDPVEPYRSRLTQKGIEVLYSVNHHKINFSRFYTVRKNVYDAVFISRPHNMKEVVDLIKTLNPDQRIIYDAEALFAQREILRLELQEIRLPEHEKKVLIQEEIDLMSKADLVVTVSEHEKQLIERHRIVNVKVLSHCVDAVATSKSFEQRKDILFLGGFTPASPNEDAILSFVRDAFPAVHQRTGVKLWIVGTNFLESIQQLSSDRIIVTGRVENVREYYERCKLFVVPTRYAAGISLKLLESLAHGVPAVVTPLIARQMGLDENVVLIGKDPQDFTEKIVRCYTEKETWSRLRNNGLNYIVSKYNRRIFTQTLRELMM